LLAALLGMLALFLAGYIAIAEIRKFQHRVQREKFIGEIRNFAPVFEAHRTATGTWPAGTHSESRVPPGMENALAKTSWIAGPPFGGAYDWIPPQLPPPASPASPRLPDPNAPAIEETAAAFVPPPKREPGNTAKAPLRPGMIAVTAFSPGPPLTLSEDDLRYIDRKLDDGNLATGRFRTGFNRWPIYLIGPRP